MRVRSPRVQLATHCDSSRVTIATRHRLDVPVLETRNKCPCFAVVAKRSITPAHKYLAALNLIYFARRIGHYFGAQSRMAISTRHLWLGKVMYMYMLYMYTCIVPAILDGFVAESHKPVEGHSL